MSRTLASLALLALGCTEYHVYPFEPWTPGEVAQDGSLDLLLVIDNSCSMGDDWGTIWYGLTRLPEDLEEAQPGAWTISLVSADVTDLEDSREPWPMVIESPADGWEMTETLERFKGRANTAEAGLGASLPWANASVESVVFVSDEKDQSALDAGPMPASEWREYWGDVWTTAVVGNGTCGAEEGEGYLEVADRVVGICTTSPWSPLDR